MLIDKPTVLKFCHMNTTQANPKP